jgi:hypothetical protein
MSPKQQLDWMCAARVGESRGLDEAEHPDDIQPG